MEHVRPRTHVGSTLVTSELSQGVLLENTI